MSTLEMYRAATREALVRAHEPVKTSDLVARVNLLLGQEYRDDFTGEIVAAMHALVTEGVVTKQATATQTLWNIEREPHQCLTCYEYPESPTLTPCQACVDDCPRCCQVRDSIRCDHNGVFSRPGGRPEWCGSCQRWVPYADL